MINLVSKCKACSYRSDISVTRNVSGVESKPIVSIWVFNKSTSNTSNYTSHRVNMPTTLQTVSFIQDITNPNKRERERERIKTLLFYQQL